MKNPGIVKCLTIFLSICTFVGTAQLPIKPGRIVSFSSNESSYTDVDVSPDGNTLLVSFWGQLYSLPANGGLAKQLTHDYPVRQIIRSQNHTDEITGALL